MTKTELMKTYTVEQLAEMVIKLNNATDSLKYSDSFLKSGLFDNPAVATCEAKINILQNKINNLEEENGRLQSKLDTYNNYLLPRCTKEAKEMIDHNHFTGVRIVTWEQWNNRGEKSMNISDIQKCQDEYEKLLKESPLEGVMNKITKDILEQKNNAMAMEFTRVICDLLKRYGVYVHCAETKFGEEITANSIEEQYGIVFDSMDFSQHDKEFADKIKELQSEVEKYRKAFEEAKKERDCQVTEYWKKIEELTNENEKLKGDVGSEGYQEKQEKTNNFYGMYKCAAKDLSKDNLLMFLGILTKELLKNGIDFRYEMENEPKVWDITSKNDKTVADLLPTEPIKVAEILITAKGECEPLHIGNNVFKDTYRIFDVSELRQIAEHLLVYCNHNKEEEE